MSEFFAITLIILLATISPGPDFAIVTQNALLYNRKVGIFTALGVALSLIIHTSYCILGLALVIAKSIWFFDIIKYTGAGYLIYIGIKSGLAKVETTEVEAQQSISLISSKQAFMQGLLCNLLNPKAILFLLAFFTLVIKPGMTWLFQAAYAVEIVLVSFIWFSWLSCMITHAPIRKRLAKIQPYIVKCIGIALIGFGTSIALMHAVV